MKGEGHSEKMIKGGRVATAADAYEADILIDNGKIVQIGQNLSEDGAEIIDATGKYVLPGGLILIRI